MTEATPSCLCIARICNPKRSKKNKEDEDNGTHSEQSPKNSKKHKEGEDNSLKSHQNLVASTYRAKFGGHCRDITVTWSKNTIGQDLCVSVGDKENQSSCKVHLRPWCVWRKRGSKRLRVDESRSADVLWDLSAAKFCSGPEPRDNYYVAVVSNNQAVLLLGDMNEAACKAARVKRSEDDPAVLLSRKEHVLGKRCFATRAEFGISGQSHEVAIEYQMKGSSEPALFIRIDQELVIEVKQLVWKFRGNDTIYVAGSPVQILWDVHDWLFSPGLGHGMFLFTPVQNKIDKMECALNSEDGAICSPKQFCHMLYAWKSD
ncbi:hypothetical protein SUGI_0011370 [Cryptomeria japonica]|uniref:uncharacterized protein LOC131041947 n=1 Tax=Cryptomeria japonica TaxID=3369 RepID=UPI002408C290|nr:uncharacterized protein LOC131041947 [Cryptomeria japonica]GLJ05108.1 hypothetical protein SUGI_0011370 [Cryptomeria japonica]